VYLIFTKKFIWWMWRKNKIF